MKIFVIDELSPEDDAMLQALYSRSAESVEVHLEKVKKAGSGKFMDNYYVGYNHKSIADCGSTTIYIEGVSMLAAKAIQNNPMYSGQETSSRYVDFSKGNAVDPVGTAESRQILEAWYAFYVRAMQPTIAHVMRTHPQRDSDDAKTYINAVKARAFDILRGFLPAGSKTQLSWHTNLRQADDHLAQLHYHPLDEVRDIAARISSELIVKYPSTDMLKAAISGVVDRGDDRSVRLVWMADNAMDVAYPPSAFLRGDDAVFVDAVLLNTSGRLRDGVVPEIAVKRPRGAGLPHWVDDYGQVYMGCALDYGSFRDWQRHRKGVVRMPILDMRLGFHPWYLEQLDEDTRDQAAALIKAQEHVIAKLDCTSVEMQNYIPLGYRVPVESTMGLSGTVYFLDLRSQRTVHPTLRQQVLKLTQLFRRRLPQVALHVDEAADDWTIRRGTQTITEK